MGMNKPNDWRKKKVQVNAHVQPLTPQAIENLRHILEKAENGEYTSYVFTATLTEEPENDHIDCLFANVGMKEVSMMAGESIIAVRDQLEEDNE